MKNQNSSLYFFIHECLLYLPPQKFIALIHDIMGIVADEVVLFIDYKKMLSSLLLRLLKLSLSPCFIAIQIMQILVILLFLRTTFCHENLQTAQTPQYQMMATINILPIIHLMSPP